jgi:hypothetical protein
MGYCRAKGVCCQKVKRLTVNRGTKHILFFFSAKPLASHSIIEPTMITPTSAKLIHILFCTINFVIPHIQPFIVHTHTPRGGTLVCTYVVDNQLIIINITHT